MFSYLPHFSMRLVYYLSYIALYVSNLQRVNFLVNHWTSTELHSLPAGSTPALSRQDSFCIKRTCPMRRCILLRNLLQYGHKPFYIVLFLREDTMYYLSELLVAAATIGSWIHMFRKGGEKLLSRRGLSSLKYYTTLSNLFAGIVSLLILLHAFSGGKGSVSPLLSLLKYSSSVSVALTFLVVLIFLGPRMGYRPLFAEEQLCLHAIGPLLAILTFIFSPLLSPLTFRDSFLALIPTLLYAVVYAGNILKNGFGEGENTNDWYGFGIGGVKTFPVVILIVLTVTWGLAMALLRLRG